MKKLTESESLKKQIDISIKERDYCDKDDFEKRGYLNAKIESLMSRYEIELNKEMGIQ